MTSSQLDKNTIDIRPSADQTGAAAGKAVAEDLNAAIADHGNARVVFASAPSQEAMIATLARQPVDWSHVFAYHMDEYIGLAADHPQSFGQWLAERLPSGLGGFDRICPGELPQSEIARYRANLATPMDVVCLGIGVNGHLAFNEPGASFDDPEPVRRIELDPTSRRQQVDDGCFGTLNDVPTAALTLTIPPLVGATRLTCTVLGDRKAEAVAAAFTGPVTERCPASVLQTRSDARIFLDEPAAARLDTNAQATEFGQTTPHT